jgi:site-specific DNA recombinase
MPYAKGERTMPTSDKLVRAAQYARYSSDKQRGESIDAQIRAMDEYWRRKGYTVVRRYAMKPSQGSTL